MSLASDYVRSASDGSLRPASARPERPARWTNMHSASGSQVGTPLSSRGERIPLSSRDERKLIRSPSEADAYGQTRRPSELSGSYTARPQRRPSEVSGGYTARSQTTTASQKKARAAENAEIRRILDAVGTSIKDHYHSLHKGLRDISTDPEGNIRRGDIRRFFQTHHVPTRMADKVFDHMMATAERKGSTLSLGTFKSTFDQYVGAHVFRNDSHDGSNASHHHHHHHNVHGLLRPRHSLASHCSVVNADTQHKEMSKATLTKIAKQMTGNQQSRYMDKYGNIERQEIQHLFESYGLTPEQGNELFDSIDTGRTGEIKFKQLHEKLAPFLHVDVEKRKAPRGTGKPLDDDMVREVCGHIGEKAAAKHKNLRGAFRFVDRDFDAKVDRYEVRNFFRNYGSKTKLADRFFDAMDVGRTGKIDFHDFKEFFAPYIEPGYHAPVHGESQKQLNKSMGWADSHYGLANCGKGVGQCQQQSTWRPITPASQLAAKTPRSSRSSGATSVSANMGEDELHATKFGRFQGVSTYSASFNPWLYHGHM